MMQRLRDSSEVPLRRPVVLLLICAVVVPTACLLWFMNQAVRNERLAILDVQRKLYQWSREHPSEPYRELWNWVTDPRNLRCAWARVAGNRGSRASGIDGVTVGMIQRAQGETAFLEGLRAELRQGAYLPSPCRRRWIPKPGKPGEFRPLGIPTIKDRVVQSAVKQVLEPIFEAQFWHVSYGFRLGRGCHGALEHIRMAMRPRATASDGKRHTAPYQWVIEGDIKGCFDHIDHHRLMQRLRQRVADRKVNRLIVQFLKAGVLTEEQLVRTDAGTPQGGIISPLLANIALSAIEERYERWTDRRTKTRENRKSDGVTAAMFTRGSDRRAGRAVFFPIRYADDFVILVHGSRQEAEIEKTALAEYLRQKLRLELSPEKTRITALTDGFEFLGHRVRLRWDDRYGLTPRLEIPKAKAAQLRRKIKALTHRDRVGLPLGRMLWDLNLILRGWGYFYHYCTGAKDVFSRLDWYVGDRIWRWLGKKYAKAGAGELLRHRQPSTIGRRRVWRAGACEQFLMGRIPVRRYRRGWMGRPDYAQALGEPDA